MTIQQAKVVRRLMTEGWKLEKPSAVGGDAELRRPGHRSRVVARGVWLRLARKGG